MGHLGFECKCKYIFCKNHRLAESHNCTYDYKKQERQKLVEKMPKLIAKRGNSDFDNFNNWMWFKKYSKISNYLKLLYI